MDKLLMLLKNNARCSLEDMAAMLNRSPDEIAHEIDMLEKNGIIKGYNTVIDWEKAGREYVSALIELKVTPEKHFGFDQIAEDIVRFKEVDSLYLFSGGYDLAVMVHGKSYREVALFVAERLAILDNVISTATHFVLKKYKEKGLHLTGDPVDERRDLGL